MIQIYSQTQLKNLKIKPPSDYCRKKFNGAYFYTKDDLTFKALFKMYKNEIEKQIKEYYLVNKSFLVNTLKFSKYTILDKKLKSGLINLLFHENKIIILPSCSFNNNQYYFSVCHICKYNFVQNLINKTTEQLFVGNELNLNDYGQKIFPNINGRYYQMKCLFDHLYFIGIANYKDRNNITLSFNIE